MNIYANNTPHFVIIHPPCGLPGGVDLLCQTAIPGGWQFSTLWNINPGGGEWEAGFGLSWDDWDDGDFKGIWEIYA